jgi:hypothetical protein
MLSHGKGFSDFVVSGLDNLDGLSMRMFGSPGCNWKAGAILAKLLRHSRTTRR